MCILSCVVLIVSASLKFFSFFFSFSYLRQSFSGCPRTCFVDQLASNRDLPGFAFRVLVVKVWTTMLSLLKYFYVYAHWWKWSCVFLIQILCSAVKIVNFDRWLGKCTLFWFSFVGQNSCICVACLFWIFRNLARETIYYDLFQKILDYWSS